MKTSGMLFWFMIACMVIFYVQVGNEMHEERLDVLKFKTKDDKTVQDTK